MLKSERLFIGVDFNRHIGRKGDGFDTTHGGFGFGDGNSGRVPTLDFVVVSELSIVSSYFKKKEADMGTFKSGSTRTQINYFLMRTTNRSLCRYCKEMPSECLMMQHRLLVMDVEINLSLIHI